MATPRLIRPPYFSRDNPAWTWYFLALGEKRRAELAASEAEPERPRKAAVQKPLGA